ncbi:UNVERIFIED_ORG: hypothetical protein GGD58_003510 [Rhizobium pisi]
MQLPLIDAVWMLGSRPSKTEGVGAVVVSAHSDALASWN